MFKYMLLNINIPIFVELFTFFKSSAPFDYSECISGSTKEG